MVREILLPQPRALFGNIQCFKVDCFTDIQCSKVAPAFGEQPVTEAALNVSTVRCATTHGELVSFEPLPNLHADTSGIRCYAPSSQRLAHVHPQCDFTHKMLCNNMYTIISRITYEGGVHAQHSETHR
jgi:hypothetical protein